LPGGARLATAAGVAADGWAGLTAAGPDQRRDRSPVTGHNRTDEAAPAGPARPAAGGAGVGSRVHFAGAASLAGAGGATVPRSGVHERVLHLPGDPRRGAK